MVDFIRQLFLDLYEVAPRWNFIFFHDPVQWERVVSGFWVTVQLSVACVIFSVVIGVVGAWLQGSHLRLVRNVVQGYIQFFRNTPPFVQLLFFYFALGQFTPTYSPDGWLEVPIMANISEIVRGAVLSVPTAQWEASEALAFSRTQTLWRIILPQCFKRMIPPWMNWYAILTMATPLCSLLGVEELITLSRQAMEGSDNHPELLVPFYGFALLIFFAYCYPIARWTIRLERRFAVKL